MNSKRKQPERAKFKHSSPGAPSSTLPAVLGVSLPRFSPSVHTPAQRSSRRLGRSGVCTRHQIPRAPPASWVGGARGQPQREFPCRRAAPRRDALHAGRSPAARGRPSRAGRRLGDRELRTAQPPPPRVRRAWCPEIVAPPAPAPRSAAPTPRPQPSGSSGLPGLQRHSNNEVSPALPRPQNELGDRLPAWPMVAAAAGRGAAGAEKAGLRRGGRGRGGDREGAGR